MIRLIAASKGYSHYENSCMVAYRTGNPNSASGVIRRSKDKLKNSFFDLHNRILDEFDEYSNYQYRDVIEKEKQRKLLLYQIKVGHLSKMLTNPEFEFINKKYLCKQLCYRYLSGFYVALRKIYRRKR